VMGGQVEDQGPALQLHQAHPEEELEHPVDGGPVGQVRNVRLRRDGAWLATGCRF
jgi:hypothetical protein